MSIELTPRAAKLMGESLENVSTEADLRPGAPPSVLWEDGMVEMKCSPPPPNLRPRATGVAKQGGNSIEQISA